ncbi:hypothetical protein ONZ43_g5502 [Nemania bipapillata]|uniref:Uncharacterized protein n=1 Tax=Nemania bipapillata TaxID=110536 RepID=A0ACC2IA06_9PEZI|nr:hypothetical protein ONZ43_g5502 [Nemania bipapillata]
MDEEDLRRYLASVERFNLKVRREMLDPEASRGNDNTLYTTMESDIIGQTRVYTGTDKPIECFEPQIRNLWYMFTISAQHIDVDHPAQDRLIRIITSLQYRGVLRKVANPKRTLIPEMLGTGGPNAKKLREVEGLEIAETSQGRLWVDLPFLVHEHDWLDRVYAVTPSANVA